MASDQAWFSSTTHLATITVLPRYFYENKTMRNIRAILMVGFALLLVCSQVLVYSANLIDAPYEFYFGCPMARKFHLYSVDLLYPITTITWLVFVYTNRLVFLYTKPQDRSSTRSWIYTVVARKRGLTLPMSVSQGFDERIRHTHSAFPETQERNPVAGEKLLFLATRSFVNSFFWEILWLCFSASYGISMVTFRWEDSRYSIDDTSDLDHWGFGQLIPLCFLVLPILTGIEAYTGMYCLIIS